MHTYWEDIVWALRDFSPIALVGFAFGLLCLLLWYITKWREFVVVGVTAAIYVLPFATMGSRW